jgi:hypothetical protein
MKNRAKCKVKHSHPMTRSGMSLVTLYKFLNQPTVKELIEEILKYEKPR